MLVTPEGRSQVNSSDEVFSFAKGLDSKSSRVSDKPGFQINRLDAKGEIATGMGLNVSCENPSSGKGHAHAVVRNCCTPPSRLEMQAMLHVFRFAGKELKSQLDRNRFECRSNSASYFACELSKGTRISTSMPGKKSFGKSSNFRSSSRLYS